MQGIVEQSTASRNTRKMLRQTVFSPSSLLIPRNAFISSSLPFSSAFPCSSRERTGNRRETRSFPQDTHLFTVNWPVSRSSPLFAETAFLIRSLLALPGVSLVFSAWGHARMEVQRVRSVVWYAHAKTTCRLNQALTASANNDEERRPFDCVRAPLIPV